MNKKFFYKIVALLLLFVGAVCIRFFIGGDYASWLKQLMGVVIFFLGAVYGYIYYLYVQESKKVFGGDVL